MAYSKLSGEVKAFIVQSLASLNSPSAVAAAVESRFGVSITRQAIEAYDPHKHSGRRLSEKWRQLFEDTRQAFLEETRNIGISHRAVRLHKLDQQVALAEEKHDSLTLLKLLQQAKREMDAVNTTYRRSAARAGRRPVEIDRGPADDEDPISNRERARNLVGIFAKAARERPVPGSTVDWEALLAELSEP
jgi:hypothetical protein